MKRLWSLIHLAGSLLALALMQPLGTRPTPAEGRHNRAQRERLRAGGPPATAAQALTQAARELLKVLTMQPTRPLTGPPADRPPRGRRPRP